MNTKQVLMTPEWAQSLLALNTNNRPTNARRVAELTKAINDGQWLLSHQGIALGSNGVLLDGQHRLHAIVLSGKAVPILLSHDCDPSIFRVVDTGQKRSAGQVLAIESVRNAHTVAATCRILMACESFPHQLWTSHNVSYTNADIHGWFLPRADAIQDAVSQGVCLYWKFSLVKATGLSAFIYLASSAGWEGEALDRFLAQLCDGVDLKECSPVFSFRRALINGNSGQISANGTKSSQALVASLITIFNAWVQKKNVKVFRVPSFPPMPVVIGR
jgi:hypothetical protein